MDSIRTDAGHIIEVDAPEEGEQDDGRPWPPSCVLLTLLEVQDPRQPLGSVPLEAEEARRIAQALIAAAERVAPPT